LQVHLCTGRYRCLCQYFWRYTLYRPGQALETAGSWGW